MTAMKRCTRCGRTRALAEFPPNRYHRDGHQSYCRPCGNEMRRLRHAENPERDRVYNSARGRALSRLADLYPGEYQSLLREELDNARVSA